jgi:type IV secretion system protein VirD4
LICVLKEVLEKRGETIRVLNPGGLWEEILGSGDCYNPLDIIVDGLERPGGLRDVPDDLREQSAQILPEPAQSDGENTYWREGSRKCMSIAMILQTMIEGRDATLSSVALLIEDRDALETNLRWIVGIDAEGNEQSDGPMPIENCAWAKTHDAADLAEFIQWVRAQARSLLAVVIVSPVTPHLRWNYTYRNVGQHRVYVACDYIGACGVVPYRRGNACPLLVLVDLREVGRW